MFGYIIHRLLIMIPTLIAISVIIFVIIQLPPGDYFSTYIAELQAQGEAVDLQKIQFLKEHARTYFASFDIDRLVEFIRKRQEPTRHAEFFRPPKLLGKGRSVSGQGPARLKDDLTERIYVAYHALRRIRIRNARGRIAAVLNRLGLETHP